MTDPLPSSRREERGARIGLGVGLPLLTFGLAVVPYLLLRDQLPTQLATRFDASGRPDDSSSPFTFILATGLIRLPGWALMVFVAIRRRPFRGNTGQMLAFLGGFLAGLGAGIAALTLFSQRNLADWHEATAPWPTVTAAVGLGLAVAMTAAYLTSLMDIVSDPPTTGGSSPVMDLAPDERAVWTSRLSSRPLGLIGLANVGVGLAMVATTLWRPASGLLWIEALLIATGVLVRALATITVRADRDGLRVRYGILPWPVTRIGIDRIDRAAVIDVRPMEWGGWGYRGLLSVMRSAAVVLRAGPGIRLDLTDGKVFVVTVDQPRDGVAVLNAGTGAARR